MKKLLEHKIKIIVSLALLCISLFLVMHLRYSRLKKGEEFGVDVFYHITMADAGPFFCLQKQFHHTVKSIWRTNFYDKEFLFHLYLSVIRKWEVMLGLHNTGPPFNTAYFFTVLLVFAVFTWVLYKAGGVPGLFALPAFIFLAPGFTNRLLMLRPHLFSIVLMIMSAWAFSTVRSKKQLWIPLLMAFLFVYSYSNPHFVVIPAFAVALILLAEKKIKLAVFLFTSAVAGFFIFMTLHPQFPNTFILWKVQCLDVVLEAVTKGNRGIASELRTPQSYWFKYNWQLFFIGAVNIGIFIFFAGKVAVKFLSEHRGWKSAGLLFRVIRRRLGRFTMILLILQSLYIILLCFSLRAVEYALPFSVLCFSALIFNLTGKRGVRQFYAVGIISLFLIITPGLLWHWTGKLQNIPSKEFASYKLWAADHLERGAYVANLGWGDFTRLFYAAPHCRYMIALDPMFGYAAFPDLYKRLRKFHRGEVPVYPEEMTKITGADFLFIGNADSSESKRAFVMVKYMGYKPVYHGPDGTLFILKK